MRHSLTIISQPETDAARRVAVRRLLRLREIHTYLPSASLTTIAQSKPNQHASYWAKPGQMKYSPAAAVIQSHTVVKGYFPWFEERFEPLTH